MSQLHSLFPQKVRLEDSDHRYWHDDGREFMSFSRLFGFLSEKADFDTIAGFVAKKEGTDADAVKAKWKKQTDEGTRIDKALELYAQTGQILKENEDIAPVVIKVLEKYKPYHRCYEQVVVYNEEFRTAGSIDKLCILSNRKDSKFHMKDFKRFEDGMSYVPKGQAWLNYPLNHLPNSKYIKICLQLSYYSWHYEKLTNMRCEAQFIDMIRPIKDKDGKITSYSNIEIPAPYLKLEVEAVLNHYQMNILSLLDSNNLQPAF